jgi:hypothetical protein
MIKLENLKSDSIYPDYVSNMTRGFRQFPNNLYYLTLCFCWKFSQKAEI